MGRRRAGAFLLTAVVTTGLLAMTGAQQQAAPTPYERFAKMLPAIQHDRCVNCHGGVNPISGYNHGGGKQTEEDCGDCHTEVKKWETVSDHFFRGKDGKALCGMFAEFAMQQGRAGFIDHLEGDPLIARAFLGDKALDPATGPKIERPRMTREEFLELGKDWITQGQGACEVLGTISLEETVTSVDSFHVSPNDQTVKSQEGRRTVTVTLRNGQYHAVITTAGKVITSQVQQAKNAKGLPCFANLTITKEYSGSDEGLARVAIKDTVFFIDTEPPQTDYRIDITLPVESTFVTTRTVFENTCGMPIPDFAQDTTVLDWPRATFVLEGHIQNAATDGRVGVCDREITHGQVGSKAAEKDRSIPCNRFANMGNSETPALMDRGADIAFHDGKDIPFRALSRWNLKFERGGRRP